MSVGGWIMLGTILGIYAVVYVGAALFSLVDWLRR